MLLAAKQIITNGLTIGLCEGDGVCPAGASASSRGGFYLFEWIQVEADKAVKCSSPFIDWIKNIWSQLADVSKEGGLMASRVIVGLMLKLL